MTRLMHDSERFSSPIHGAEQVTSRVWRDGVEYTVSDAIAYDVQLHAYRGKERTWTERREGVIDELWVEKWWGDPRELLYAEVTQKDGNAVRVWFHRDKVGMPTGIEGLVPAGAMF